MSKILKVEVESKYLKNTKVSSSNCRFGREVTVLLVVDLRWLLEKIYSFTVKGLFCLIVMTISLIIVRERNPNKTTFYFTKLKKKSK